MDIENLKGRNCGFETVVMDTLERVKVNMFLLRWSWFFM